MKYISVDDLQAYCDNQKDHSITPNEFQRMNHIEIVRCKDCCCCEPTRISPTMMPLYCILHGIECTHNWFCADGVRKEGR